MAGIYWLASYPKSGNTWLRLFLSSLKSGGGEPDINRIDLPGAIACSRSWFDEYTGIDSAGLSRRSVEDLRPAVYRAAAAELSEDVYCKVHEPYLATTDGAWLFPPEASRGAVYLVRDPRDVAVSYAHHENGSIDAAIAAMADTGHDLLDFAGRSFPQLPQRLGTWSDHVESWLGAPLAVLVIRYEDMVLAPRPTFRAVVDFLRLEASDTLIDQALAVCSFASLQRQERDRGFREKPRVAETFFRLGAVGEWRRRLSADQVGRIVGDHGPAMARLGYLDGPPAPDTSVDRPDPSPG